MLWPAFINEYITLFAFICSPDTRAERNTYLLRYQKKMFKLLSGNTQTVASVCCISVVCSSIGVRHLNGLNKASLATILCNVLNVPSQNFSRKFCAIIANKSWNFLISVNAFYNYFPLFWIPAIVSLYPVFWILAILSPLSCILNSSHCIPFILYFEF